MGFHRFKIMFYASLSRIRKRLRSYNILTFVCYIILFILAIWIPSKIGIDIYWRIWIVIAMLILGLKLATWLSKKQCVKFIINLITTWVPTFFMAEDLITNNNENSPDNIELDIIAFCFFIMFVISIYEDYKN